MTFLEYIEARIKDEMEFDAIIGDVYMPATLGFCDDWRITDYCKNKYERLLNGEIVVHKGANDVVEVLIDDSEIGESFCYAVAGYIAESEWNKLFIGEDSK